MPRTFPFGKVFLFFCGAALAEKLQAIDIADYVVIWILTSTLL